MVPDKVKCNGCGADLEVRTFRKFVVCPYCGERTEFEGFQYRAINWKDSMYKNVKKWTDCPACRSRNMYLGPEKQGWKCPDCGYVWREYDRKHGVLWFCDDCEAYMNIQPGFSDKTGTWTCTECGFANDVSKQNVL